MEIEKLSALVSKVQSGDRSAADDLYSATYQGLYYYILKTVNDSELAQDLLQETFIEIYSTIQKLQEPGAFLKWSRQIAYHKCTAYNRKTHELLVDENEEGQTVFDTLEEDRTEFIPHEALDKEDLKQTIHNILAQLPMDQRAAIMMRYFDELSVKEIAEIQGVSEGTVKSRLNYARKSIEKSVEDYEKKNGIKLHCVGILPLLLWLFRQQMASLTAPAASSAVSAAAAAAVPMAAQSAAVAAKAVGGLAAKKLIAGIVAAAVVAGGAATALLLQNKPESITAATTAAVTTPPNSGSTTAPTTIAPTTAAPTIPTEEQQAQMVQYVLLITDMNDVPSDIQKKLTQLAALPNFNAWAGTEYASAAIAAARQENKSVAKLFNPQSDWDRDAILARYDVVKNVYLGHSITTEDNLGNIGNGSMYYTRRYSSDGKLSNISRSLSFGNYLDNTWDNFKLSDIYGSYFDPFRIFADNANEPEYDEAGRLTKLTYRHNGTVKALFEISYNKDGTMSKVVKKENTKETEYTFSYSQDGRVVTFTSFYIIIVYTYNEDGTLAKEEYKRYNRDLGETMEEAYLTEDARIIYNYDANGHLTSADYKLEVYSGYKLRDESAAYTFTTDDAGRVTQVVEIPGDTIHLNHKGDETVVTAQYAKITYQLYYGDYFVEKAAN